MSEKPTLAVDDFEAIAQRQRQIRKDEGLPCEHKWNVNNYCEFCSMKRDDR